MKLLPKTVAEKIPPLYSQENENDPVVYVKFFDPCSNWTWYVLEYSPEERLFFGYVVGFDAEFGYFSLDELTSIKNRFGLGIERDLYWKPTPLSRVLNGEVR